jgi:hypothetical protein
MDLLEHVFGPLNNNNDFCLSKYIYIYLEHFRFTAFPMALPDGYLSLKKEPLETQ